MYLRRLFIGAFCAFFAFNAYAGGDPDYVKYPKGYQESFTHYATMNRNGKEQVAKMYANEAAISSYGKDQKASAGSVIVMEVYKPKKDVDGKAVEGSDGHYEIDKLAAVAVLERRDSWDDSYPADHRLGGWGFAIYKPDGSLKPNKLDCAGCHAALADQDFLFTHQQLVDFVKSN